MIKHNASEMDQFELARMLARGGEFDVLLDMAKKTPNEIHLFPIAEGWAALAISEEAKEELLAKLSRAEDHKPKRKGTLLDFFAPLRGSGIKISRRRN